ncbi:GCN5-related N-acetyltransferase [Shewanella denitrificans OS217]|jgi:GNAT superfamily N-acetyltransferase|uniref:GCN5-related N-acetyltransferase n=1 Tax=Shewanella denitrificans (strain OS217 / ATCC BAA-1090 / DSM 15013) TaxID=318161 RepID=Q12P22_SHEDO|nr:GNAT family N-acetyltransferase [Shewanella denitrificans]ABE54804.1 GCN5-related N-acetyltransferase [Shewanella denitrificans OS217]
METAPLEQYRAVYLTADDLRIAASIIYNAYQNDAYFLAILFSGDKVSYEQKLRAAIREELNELWQQEQPLIGWFDGDRLIGVACIITHQVPIGESRYWHWRFKMLLGTGWKSTQGLMQKETSIIEQLPSDQCGILQFIALAPSEQHKGHGGQLIEAVLSWCDEQPKLEGLGVFVSNDSHSHLFQQHGFINLTSMKIGDVDGDLLFYHGQLSE